MHDHDAANPGTSKRPRLQLSLLAILIFMMVVCVAWAWLNRPSLVDIQARLLVDLTPHPLLENALHVGVRDSEIFHQMNLAHFKSFEIHQTQLAHLKSNAMLQAAISDPACANLPIIAQRTDPVAWLQDLLQVDFESNSALLVLRIRLPEDQAKQGIALLQAVIDSYLQIAAAAEKQQIELELQNAKTEHQKLLEKVEAAFQEIKERGPVYPWAEQFLEQLVLEGTERDKYRVLQLLDMVERALPAIADLREQRGQDDPRGWLLLEQAERDAARVLELEIQVRYLEAFERELPHQRLIQGPYVLTPPIEILGYPIRP